MPNLDLPFRIPSLAAIIVTACLLAIAMVGLHLLWHKRRTSPSLSTDTSRRSERTMLASALIPSVIVWLAVLSVSFLGLTGFARDTMDWHHWTNILVPLSLDGISVSFGGWAFVAVHRQRHPGRAYKVVLAAATLSATLNYVHGTQRWSTWAGLYLAFLSLAGMTMFHEMLKQFMAKHDEHIDLHSRYPRFGQRWLYAPISTFRARRLWIIEPPPANRAPTIRNALDYATQIRTRQHQPDGPTRGKVSQSTASPDHTLDTRRADNTRLNGQASPDRLQQNAETRAVAIGDAVSDIAVPTGSRLGAHRRSARDMNRVAEQLWIDQAHAGVELTAAQLLEMLQRHHGVSRSQRWAVDRAAAARNHWERMDGAEDAAAQ